MPTLEYCRFIRGINQFELDRLSGFAQSTISAWENGYRMPNPMQRVRLADVLGMNVNDLHFELLSPEEIKKKMGQGQEQLELPLK